MSIWRRIAEALASLAAGEGLSRALEKLSAPPERSVAFTIACIAMGAKMAKADGRVTRDEVDAFRAIFTLPDAPEAEVGRVFDLARRDVAGFEAYAAQAARMFGEGAPILADLLEALFIIAAADGELHERELALLRHCAQGWGVDEAGFARLHDLYDPAQDNPWAVLGLARGADAAAIRARRRELARQVHPDRLAADGLPEEALKIAQTRMARVNAACDRLLAGASG